MCGIAGIVFVNREARVPTPVLQNMAKAIAHRGPEDEGFHSGQGGFLVHRRLSIVDLAGGHQPLANENQDVFAICNGEIYNFPDLRPLLEARGHVFRTHSDSEILVHLYEEYGDKLAEHLRGQFAFAIWDETKRVLVLGRDRLGKKPLYYFWDQQKLLFASEMKGILAFGGLHLRLNEAVLGSYLNLGYIPQPDTQFVEIRKLPSAHILVMKESGVEVKPYWQHPIPISARKPFDLTQELRSLEEKLLEATRIRFMSDVPIGAFLSGGVDSSLVVAFMMKVSHVPMKTFNVSFQEKSYDESRFARRVAKYLGTEHHEIPVDYRIEDLMEKILVHFDEPFADSSAIPQYLVAKAARSHVKVVLSGDAGDDIFAGYRRYLGRRIAEAFHHLPGRWRGALNQMAEKYQRDGDLYVGKSVKKMFFRFLRLARYYEEVPASSCLPFFNAREVGALLSPEVLARQPRENPWAAYFNSQEDAVAQMLYLDQRTYFVDDILTKVDRMSMAHALEVRSPLMDHELVEWAARLPLGAKLHGWTGKYILKKLAERYLPCEIIYRRKQGFAVPIGAWFRKELRALVQDLLLSKNEPFHQYFNPQAIRVFLDEHMEGRRDWSQQLWALLSLRYTFRLPAS